MSNKQGIELLKKIIIQFKAFLFSRDALSFLFFLLLSTGFWFSNIVHKVRDATIIIPVQYSALPNNFTIVNQPAREIKLNIKDEGLNLFAYSKKKLVPLSIDLSGADANGGCLTLSSRQILSRLSRHLQPTTSVVGFTPDSISVKYEKMDALTLPVKLNVNVELAQQYIQSDTITIIPNTVTVYGKREVLKKIKEIETETLTLTQLKDSVSMQIKLLPIDSVNFSTDKVNINFGVEMFTEKRIRVPVTFTDVPDNFSVKSFPALVDVAYNIGISHYNTNYDNLSIVVDYKDLRQNKQEKQKLKIINKSSKIFNVRMMPEEIEFVLEEKQYNY